MIEILKIFLGILPILIILWSIYKIWSSLPNSFSELTEEEEIEEYKNKNRKDLILMIEELETDLAKATIYECVRLCEKCEEKVSEALHKTFGNDLDRIHEEILAEEREREMIE